MDGMIENVLN